MNAYGFLLGSLTLLPFLFLFGVPVFAIHTAAVPFVLYLGVFVSGLSYLTYFKGLGIIGAGKGSLVFFVKPGLAAILAWMLLGEKLTPIFIAGTVLIVGGIALSSFPASKINRT
jgi:drug/metabolite transporter (DMT)-like permease